MDLPRSNLLAHGCCTSLRLPIYLDVQFLSGCVVVSRVKVVYVFCQTPKYFLFVMLSPAVFLCYTWLLMIHC